MSAPLVTVLGGTGHMGAAVAERLEPHAMGVRTMEGEALVLMIRPMVVDLLEAAGAEHRTAVGHLPELRAE